jgi:hypothetical protein
MIVDRRSLTDVDHTNVHTLPLINTAAARLLAIAPATSGWTRGQLTHNLTPAQTNTQVNNDA